MNIHIKNFGGFEKNELYIYTQINSKDEFQLLEAIVLNDTFHSHSRINFFEDLCYIMELGMWNTKQERTLSEI